MRSSFFVLLGLAVGATASCSLFVSLDGLDAGASDAGSDAAADVGNDVVVANDSGSNDAAPSDDADAGPFCASHPGHAICSDFDETSNLQSGGWTTTDLTQGGTLAQNTARSVSMPASMASTLPTTTGDGSASRLEYDVLLSAAPHIHAELDIWICDLTGATGDLEVFKLNQGVGQFADGIELSFGETDGHFHDEKAGMSFALAAPVPRQQWVHLAIDVVRSMSGSMTIVMNGDASAPLVDATGLDTTLDNSSDAASILVGTYGALTPACVTYYDNVVIDTQ